MLVQQQIRRSKKLIEIVEWIVPERGKRYFNRVYRWTQPNDTKKMYVGQAYDISTRHSQYRNLTCGKQTKMFRAMKKYGFENGTIEITSTEIPQSKIDDLETQFISIHNSVINGYNICRIGGSSRGFKHSEKTMAVLRTFKHWEGKKHSLETIEKMKKSATGRIKSKETCEKISIGNRGKVHSIETRKKMSLVRKKSIPTVSEDENGIPQLTYSKRFKRPKSEHEKTAIDYTDSQNI